MADELLDVYDENLSLLGVKSRRQAHADGDWHKTFHCWIVAERGDRRFVLFQLRGPDVDVYPNTLDITAAGHIAHGETAREAIRELDEELGVAVEYEALVRLGTRFVPLRVGELRLREICEAFLLRDNRDLAAYSFDPDEVGGLVEVELDDAMRLFSGQVERIGARALTWRAGRRVEEARTISAADVVPRSDDYYLTVLIMVERYFEGRSYFAI